MDQVFRSHRSAASFFPGEKRLGGHFFFSNEQMKANYILIDRDVVNN